MSIRHVLKAVAATSAATVCAAVFALGIGSGVAGASSLTSTDGNTTLTTQADCGSPPAPCTVTPGTPYSSGQKITVSTIANSTLEASNLPTADQGGDYYLLECTDAGGAPGNLPTSLANCETRTQVTIAKTTSGAFSKSMPVYDLPDSNLGEPTMTGTCDVDPNDCVVGIFVVSPGTNPSTFLTLPHLWSAPFQMSVGDGNDVGDDPGDGTPEVPLAIGLPLAAMAVVGGFALRNRRRRRQAA